MMSSLKFQTQEELDVYFSQSRLRCLLCGKSFAGLNQHLTRNHQMPAREYKIMFGIPLGYGLLGCEAKAKLITHGHNMAADVGSEQLKAMHAARSHTGGVVSHAPVITRKRQEIALEKLAGSPMHISKVAVNEMVETFCDACGAQMERSKFAVITKKSRLLCADCVKKRGNDASNKWKQNNPDRWREMQRRAYHRKMAKLRAGRGAGDE
ncbi:MAG: MucR family transcriptional regulator [Rhodospirillaceae bacterium]